MGCVLLGDVVGTSEAVAGLPGRRAKIDQLAALLRRAGADEIPVVVAFLSGELRQRQIGVGYAALTGLLREADAAAGQAAARPPGSALTVAETDEVFATIGAVSGPAARPPAGSC